MKNIAYLAGNPLAEVSVNVAEPGSLNNKYLMISDESDASEGRIIKKMGLNRPHFNSVVTNQIDRGGDSFIGFDAHDNITIDAEDRAINIGDSSGSTQNINTTGQNINITSNKVKVTINKTPYIIGEEGILAYNSDNPNPTYDTMVPPVVSYRQEYIGDISFNFSSSPATGMQLYDSSISQCRLYYAPIASTDIGETGGAIYSQNSDSLQDLKFRSVCSISIDGEDYDCTFSILKKLMHESDYHITCYICVISSAYPHNSFYRPVSDYYLPLAPDKRFVGILEVADSGQSPQYIVPNTSDWDGYISQGIDYYFPTDWFNSFGLLDFGRGIVSIKDGKIIKKTW